MTNEQVYRIAGTEKELLNHIKSRKLRYFMRLQHDNTESCVKIGLVEVVRKPGRTYLCWCDSIMNGPDCVELNFWKLQEIENFRLLPIRDSAQPNVVRRRTDMMQGINVVILWSWLKLARTCSEIVQMQSKNVQNFNFSVERRTKRKVSLNESWPLTYSTLINTKEDRKYN